MSTSKSTTLIGTPKSTFTRTIALALHELHVPFTQIDCLPKSKEAFEKGSNPFGHIPSIEIDGISIFESQAISRYLDTHYATPTATLRPSSVNAVLLDELASVSADYVFNAVEFGAVKPRIAAEQASTSEEQIKSQIADGVARMHEVLQKVENLAHQTGPYIAGNALSWADLFLYPILADLKSIPEGEIIKGKLQVLSKWMEVMEQLESVKKTYPGSVAYIRANK